LEEDARIAEAHSVVLDFAEDASRMRDVYIYDHVRTPRGKGKPDGALHEVTPVRLATQTLEALRRRNGIAADTVEEVILGTVSPAGEQGATLHRIAPILAGLGDSTPGLQINRFCASGLEAVTLAAAKIGAGMGDLMIAGGVESMSRIPIGSGGGGPHGSDPSVTFHTPFIMQGVSADLLATLNGYSRTDVDAYSVESQVRAADAWGKGYFAHSVIPVTDMLGEVLLDRDEHIRPETTMQTLGALTPSFEKMGESYGFDKVAIQRYPNIDRIAHIHTAGSSSGIVDGAAAILLGSAEAGARLGVKPRARIRAFCSVGSEPLLMLDGPEPASLKALKLAGMTVADIDLWELNEAFAAVPLRLMDAFNIPHAKMNVNGGAIAMGHPLGATGAMIAGVLVDELERRGLGTGLVTLCAAGGMATAVIVERVNQG
jgi:acetyl-CoA C-acetyltransferase